MQKWCSIIFSKCWNIKVCDDFVNMVNNMDFKELSEKTIVLFDGAMGTYFASKAPDYIQPCEMANIDRPETVKEIHKEYIAAGCDAIKTNTFSAGPHNPAFAEDRFADAIKAGCRIARQAVAEAARPAAGDSAAGGVHIFADIGPVNGAEAEEAAAAYMQIADVFVAEGIRNYIFETLSSDAGIAETAKYIKEQMPDAFIIASFAVQPDGYTRDGMYYIDIFDRMKECPYVDGTGLNCVSGALQMKELIQNADTEGMMISMMPNAGYPRVVGNRIYYNSDPGYFSEQLADVAERGISMVGGCCGTTPEYIKRTKDILSGGKVLPKVRPLRKAGSAAGSEGAGSAVVSADAEIPAGAGKGSAAGPSDGDINNRFWRRVQEGKKVIAVELDPPRKVDGTKFMSGAWALKSAGADAITIADCATARASMDSSIMSCKLRRELDIDVIPHMTCRDRNLNATKALLLGLSMEGVRNVLTVTGDPVPSAERDEVKSVYQFNSRKLAGFVSSLNRTELEKPFQIYGALNVNARNFDVQLKLAEDKIKNGVCGFLTQPVLTEDALNNIKKASQVLDAKIFGGIIPVVSSRNARFMNSEISGITVDDRITELYEGKDRQQCTELAIRISTEIAKLMYDHVDGFYLMTPFTRTDIMSELIKNIRAMG